MTSSIVDVAGSPLLLESIVTVVGEETSFTNYQGLVLDVRSGHEPEDGSIAVFFNKEVEPEKFSNWIDVREWRGKDPTPKDYKNCPRVVCFLPNELRVEQRWSSKTLMGRTFGSGLHARWHSFSHPKRPLVPNVHLCHLQDCPSGLHATQSAFINVWGTVIEVYVCEPCHKRTHGMCADAVELKHPLPW
jgi:hypothetical protein